MVKELGHLMVRIRQTDLRWDSSIGTADAELERWKLRSNAG